MKAIRLTMAQALTRFLAAQRTLIDGQEMPFFAQELMLKAEAEVPARQRLTTNWMTK